MIKGEKKEIPIIQYTLPLDKQVMNLNINMNNFYKQQRTSHYFMGAGIACSLIGLLLKPGERDVIVGYEYSYSYNYNYPNQKNLYMKLLQIIIMLKIPFMS